MRFLSCVLALLASFLLPSCVTEGPPPPDEEEQETTGPLEHVEAKIAQIISQMHNQSEDGLFRSAQLLRRYGELSLGPIGEAMEEANPRTRSVLLWATGFIGAEGGSARKGARELALPWLADPNPAVSYEAAAALAEMGDWSGVPRLLSWLDSPDRKARYKAIDVLQRIAGDDFGYDFAAAGPIRAPAVARWQEWWSARRFSGTPPREVRPAAER